MTGSEVGLSGHESVQCRVCLNDGMSVSYDVREMMFGSRETFRYFQCGRCQCLQIAAIPSDLTTYYPDNYYSYETLSPRRGGIRNRAKTLRDRYALGGRGVTGRVLYRLSPAPKLRLLSRIPIRKDSSVLDVGCGRGRLLYNLRELGFEQLLGIDPYIDSDVSHNNGLTVLKRSIDGLDGKWDVIMFHHSFEHVRNPLETLERVSELLNADGTCLIRMPTVSSYAWRHYGVDWVQLDAPRHLFLHSIESMRLLAPQASLVLSEVVYDSTAFQFWGSEQYMLDVPLVDEPSADSDDEHPEVLGKPSALFSSAQIARFARRARRLNKRGDGDQAAFYLKKANT